MATKEDSTIYQDFEPLCKWQRDEDFDVLQVHVPDFRKEDLKVRIVGKDVVTITGERNVKNGVRSRFQKQIKVCKNIKKDEIHAKFVKSGILYITLPKKNQLGTKTLPSTCLCGTESFNYTKLGVQVVAILLAATFGALLYKYCFCVPLQT